MIYTLREAEVLQGQGKTIAQLVKHFGITEQNFYRRRKWSTRRLLLEYDPSRNRAY